MSGAVKGGVAVSIEKATENLVLRDGVVARGQNVVTVRNSGIALSWMSAEIALFSGRDVGWQKIEFTHIPQGGMARQRASMGDGRILRFYGELATGGSGDPSFLWEDAGAIGTYYRSAGEETARARAEEVGRLERDLGNMRRRDYPEGDYAKERRKLEEHIALRRRALKGLKPG